MTVCIAAICENGKSVVVGSDRELTAAGLSLKFDHNEKKIDKLGEKCLVLSSGDAFLAHELVYRTSEKIKGSMNVRQIAESLRDVFMENHRERVANVILYPLGYKNFDDFLTRASSQMPLQAYQDVQKVIFGFGLNVVEFLVAGCDASGAHIFRVYYSGTSGGNWLEWCDKVGYRAVGSGLSHAFISLSVEGQHAKLGLEDTLYNVYCAKKNSELAPGVGKEDDFATVSETGINYIDGTKVAALEARRVKRN